MSTAETRPFWAAGVQGELRLPRCPRCEKLFYPPPPRCMRCLSADLEWVTVSGRATVRGWTRAFLATVPGVDPPFTIVEGELVEQADLVIVALADPSLASTICVGDAVEIVFDTDGERAFLLYHRDDEARAAQT